MNKMPVWVGVLASIATIIGAGYGVFKYVAWAATPTPAQRDQSIDQTVQTEKQSAEETGRPE